MKGEKCKIVISRIMFCALFILFLNSSNGQDICAFTPEYINTVNCLSGYTYYKDNIHANEVVKDILGKINLKNTYFVTKVCRGVNNALAVEINGIKYILLDVEWMESLSYGKNDWFQLFVIGHEMGHHILNHTKTPTKSLEQCRVNELAADEFSGYLLGMYGATLNDINSLFYYFSDYNDTNSTHPSKSKREIAVMKGFESSKKNESTVLLESLVKNANLNLSNIPYLYDNARSKFYSFLSTNNNSDLLKAIKSYQEALRFTNDPHITYELGCLFLIKGDQSKYNAALELLYQKTKDDRYILELIGNLIENGDPSTDQILSKYNAVTNSINQDNYYETICMEGIIKYYIYRARKNYDTGDNLSNYLNMAEYFCLRTLKNYNSKDEHGEMFDNKAQLYNSLGLCALLRDDFVSSFDYFSLAANHFELAKSYNSHREKLFRYHSLNLLAVYSNLALSSVRLEEWQEGLNAILKYESLYNSLSNDKKQYIQTINEDIPKESFYLKARCLHGLGQYTDAIENFSSAIRYQNNAWYLHLYRGMSYLETYNYESACDDFALSCEYGIELACRYLKIKCTN
jgi:tetratricopeptide (TPR) repeat protein